MAVSAWGPLGPENQGAWLSGVEVLSFPYCRTGLFVNHRGYACC